MNDFRAPPDPDEQQQDDHIWINANGQGWAIHSIIRDGTFMVLWRGYHPFIEWNGLIIESVDWDAYTAMALELLYGVNADEADPTTVN